ncbi:MAG: serine/threonine-protein kinase [Kofleriaceae bacterium]
MICPHCTAQLAPDARFCPTCGKAAQATTPEPAASGPLRQQNEMIGREILGRFRILAMLGEGGMGAVYRGEQMSLKRAVAIKVLRPELSANQTLLRRFSAEAAAVAKLDHPNTVKVYDFGQDADGSLFIAMELIDGQPLRQVIGAAGPLPPVRAFNIALQVAASLVDAHARSIVHRDLKPDNVMLQDRGRERDVARVLDFGIAKLRDDTRATHQAMTQAGDMLGTPQYMAPEQIKGEAIDGRTDIYALGCMIYEMVTARLPFEAPTIMAMLSKHLVEMPLPPSQRRPDLQISPAIDQVVMAALQKEPAARPANMEQYAEMLAGVLAQLPPDPSWQQPSHVMGAVQHHSTPAQPVVATPPTMGQHVATPAQQPPPYSPYPSPAPQAYALPPAKSKAPLYVVLGVLAVGGAGAGIWAATRGPDKKAAPEPENHDGEERSTPPPDPDHPAKDPWGAAGKDPWSPSGSATPHLADVGTAETPIPAGAHLNPPSGFRKVEIPGTQAYASENGVAMILAPLIAGTNDPTELANKWIEQNPNMNLTLAGVTETNGHPMATFSGQVNGQLITQYATLYITPRYRVGYLLTVPIADTTNWEQVANLVVKGATVP